MFLKRHVRTRAGKKHVYYSLTQSTRVSRSRTVQRRVLNLGELNTTQIEQWQRSIEVVEENGKARQRRLFTDREGQVPAAEDGCEVLLSTLRVCRPRQFGGPWLGCRLFERNSNSMASSPRHWRSAAVARSGRKSLKCW